MRWRTAAVYLASDEHTDRDLPATSLCVRARCPKRADCWHKGLKVIRYHSAFDSVGNRLTHLRLVPPKVDTRARTFALALFVSSTPAGVASTEQSTGRLDSRDADPWSGHQSRLHKHA